MFKCNPPASSPKPRLRLLGGNIIFQPAVVAGRERRGMNKSEILSRIDRLVAASRTAVLATVDAESWPHLRWMTPARLHGRPEALYAVSSLHLAKAAQLQHNPCVEWMLQDPSLREVVVVRGRVNIIDNPALKAEVLETLGHQLATFWKVAADQAQLVVLETVIEEAVHYLPMEGFREQVSFLARAI
jgi:general stress protein 26